AETFALIRAYFLLMDQMQEEVLILYQEVKSLQFEQREQVLQHEREMVALMKHAILSIDGVRIDDERAELLANNIFVQGHMWSFRRWSLDKQFTIEQYIQLQLGFFENSLFINV